MRKVGAGSIVNMASISSFIAQPAFVPYNATKGAILQMTRFGWFVVVKSVVVIIVVAEQCCFLVSVRVFSLRFR